MPAFNTQQDLLDYIARLEARITKLEQSSVRIDKTSDRSLIPASKTRIIFDTSTNKLYGGDGSRDALGAPFTSAWNALW